MKSVKTMRSQYAQMIIDSGVALKKGACLRIKTGIATYEFARELATYAYSVGARYVLIAIDDMQLLKSRLLAQDEKDITYIPSYEKALDDQMIQETWSLIRIDNTDERDVLLDAPAHRLGAFSKATGAFHKELKASAMNNELTWCVVCVPSLKWAQNVLGESKSEQDMWHFLAPILHLDQEDPLAAMKHNFERTEKRAEKITALNLRSLHFTSSVTDLRVGLRENHIFTGGGDLLADGSRFYPNIPSEEVFTTPDYLLTEGYVRTTRPISVMDSRVENAFFRFREGVVVEAHAEIGDQILQQYLESDEGAKRLGEIALVDQSSPIAQANVVFDSILYDENASCHFALGAGYPTCLVLDDQQADEEELLRNGCNVSQVHTDFMFGSDDLSLTGYDAEGKAYLIMKDGSFTPDFA